VPASIVFAEPLAEAYAASYSASVLGSSVGVATESYVTGESRPAEICTVFGFQEPSAAVNRVFASTGAEEVATIIGAVSESSACG
jgi:hypothetical protein